jgi:hypothetical protein
VTLFSQNSPVSSRQDVNYIQFTQTTVKLSSFIAAAFLLGAPAVQATPEPYDTPRNELLGSLCEGGLQGACRELVRETAGECAGPAGSGCLYDSRAFTVIDPEEPMVLVPGLEAQGYSRISTVQHCQELTGVADWSQLMTDAEFEAMDQCLTEHT